MWFSECSSCNKMVALPWSEVKESTIQKCYAKAEISDSACLLVANLISPFSEVDGLYELMSKLWSMEKLARWKNTSMENVISQYAATDFGSSDECGGGGRVPSITT